jgi:hypothetical protein
LLRILLGVAKATIARGARSEAWFVYFSGGRPMKRVLLATLTALSLAVLMLLDLPTDAWQNNSNEEAMPIGKTSQKLEIEYQSAKTPNLRIYRVRNTANGLRTEVLWKDDSSIFANCTLPRCPSGTTPGLWVAFKQTALSIGTGYTDFGYGINGDQFHDKPAAFVEEKPQADKAKDKDITTGIEGTVADKNGEPIVIDVDVTSKVMKKGDKVHLIYVIAIGSKKATPLVLIPNKQTGLKPKLVWESPDFERLSGAFQTKNVFQATPEKAVEVSITATKYELKRQLLKIMIGDDVLASTTAPAYSRKE